MTQTTPLSGGIFTLRVKLVVVDLLAKFKLRSFMNSRKMDGGLNFKKGHVTRPRPFHGNFFTTAVGLAVVDPLAKFKSVASSIPEILKDLKFADRQTE